MFSSQTIPIYLKKYINYLITGLMAAILILPGNEAFRKVYSGGVLCVFYIATPSQIML